MIIPLGGGALGDDGFSPASAPVAPPLSGATPADGGTVAAVWGVQVLVGAVDVTADIVGELTVEAEEGAARVADLVLQPGAGATVDVPSWTGKPVVIYFTDMSTGVATSAVVLFSGIVDLPTIDLRTRCLNLRCTDDLQGVLAGLSKAAIDTLVGGRWSPAVFNAAADAYTYAQDRLSTVPACLDLDLTRTPRLTPWAAKPTADLSFTADHILENSLVPQFAERVGLINQVDLSFGYRFPRQKSEGYQVNYDYLALHITSFPYWVRDGNPFLSRDAVRSAIQAAGGSIVSETWTALPTTGQVIPGTGGAPAGFWIPNPATDPLFCLGFSIVASFDYGQDIEETYSITVNNPASIAEIGVVRESMSGSLQGQYSDPVAVETNVLLYKNKISAIPPKDLAAVVVGLTNSADVTLTTDSNRTAAEAAIEVLVDVAKARIFAASRRSSVAGSLPLNPALDVDKTVAINADGVLAKGKVRRVLHRMAPASGRAVSDFELAICSVAGVGISHPDDATTAPAGSTAGTSSTLSAPSVTWNGLAGQDQVITITFPGVAAVERNKSNVAISQTFRAEITEDVFTITL
ncbi:MAG TPA: hypothetical protein PLU47_00770 [Azonexus sp.]|nr:hypothetical protein [Azonexus sp.]